MNLLELEAMLIRQKAAITQLDDNDETGRWELLGMIVFPSDPVLAASLEVAEQKGPSELAQRLHRGKDNGRQHNHRPSPAKRSEPRVWASV